MCTVSLRHGNRVGDCGYAIDCCSSTAGKHTPHVDPYPLPVGGWGRRICLGGHSAKKRYEGGPHNDLYVVYDIEVEEVAP